jgi:ribosome biogenesis GTPase
LALQTGEISDRMDRGRHTTRHVELLMSDGAAVADTPGFSLFEMDQLEPRELPALIPEFAPYEGKCRFAGCMHVSEPGCAVKDAVAEGLIPKGRWQRYGEILTELKEKWRNRYD